MHRSLWLEEALADHDGGPVAALEGEQTAEVCIVGGGYTGLWTALRIKELEPNCDVAVVEADVCGAGASGRNGGFLTTWWSKLGTLIKACGEEEGVRIARASDEAVDSIEAFCAEHGIDAHFRRGGWLWVATAPAQVGMWESAIAECERHDVHEFVRLTPDELHEHIDQPTHLAGAFEPRTATVHPAHLVRGLRRVALERGVRIYENSPMLSLRRAGRPRVRTPDGEITAGTTALALNAWAAAIPELSRAIVPVTSDLVATAPDHALLERMRWTRAEAIADARLMVHYYQATRDGRIVFGKGGGSLAYNAKIGDDFNHAPRRSAWVAQHMHRILPATVGAEITHTWAGPVARTDDGLPIFGHLADNVVHGGGYSGNGVGPSWVGGRILASLVLGRSDEWSSAGLVRDPGRAFPPEPVRYLGGRVVREAVRMMEEAEDRGEDPGRLAKYVAGFAPAGYARGGGRSRRK
ncbi:MAG: NAD(P)/FAD-dependent oxidoreductase [Gaiellales bacterium]